MRVLSDGEFESQRREVAERLRAAGYPGWLASAFVRHAELLRARQVVEAGARGDYGADLRLPASMVSDFDESTASDFHFVRWLKHLGRRNP